MFAMEQLLHEYGFHTEVSAINYEHQSDIIYAINAFLQKL